MKPSFLFLTLKTFSATGGIEKVCRVAGKALSEIVAENGGTVCVMSMYDKTMETDERYLPSSQFAGYAGKRFKFALASLRRSHKANNIILSHFNLLPIGFLIKKIFPQKKLVLIAHGIEVWQPVTGLKKKMLQVVDTFLPVSTFTATKLQTLNNIPAEKIKVLNNCLDPFLINESNPTLESRLRKKYNITKGDCVLLTVARIKFSEQYKGYDKVIEALHHLKTSHPTIKYLIVGKYDAKEKARLDVLVEQYGLFDRVIFTDFVKDEELTAHFNIADVYIMPSSGEGFGIVFIEALFYGLPVIAGNVDGSVDALAAGEFGLLVDPANKKQLVNAIRNVCDNGADYKVQQSKLHRKFGYETYRNTWRNLLLPQAAVKTREQTCEI